MSKLDLLVINPGDRFQVYQSLGNELTAVEPPVWAGLLTTFVRQRGYAVEIIDANALLMSPRDVVAIVEEADPRLVAIVVYGHQPSASTQNMPAAGELATQIKLANHKRHLIMLGGHVAALPERTLWEETVDYVAVGEGLWTVCDLLDMLRATTPSANEISTVRGLAYLIDGHYFSNPDAILVADVDESMPSLPWADLHMGLYRAHNWHCFGGLNRQPYAAIYTTLGCPFKCSFCCIQAPFRSGEAAAGLPSSRNSYRYWAPATIGAALQELVEHYGVRNIKIADEMFVLNRKHVEGICDEIIQRRLDLNIWAYARVDTVKEGMLPKLKAAGFNWLAFGIESGNAAVRDGVDKGFAADDMMKCLEEVRRHNINIGANYIFGLPDDNYDTMEQTMSLALTINAEYANFYSAMAYPGSPLYEQAVTAGWRLPKSWSGYSQHSPGSCPLPTKHLTAEEIVAFRDSAFRRYFEAPGYLKMMEQKFGPVALCEIRGMLAHRLERHK